MKKLTKILAFFLAGAAAAGCLSACVKQDPLAKGKINITYWAEIYQTNKDIIDELVDTSTRPTKITSTSKWCRSPSDIRSRSAPR